MKLWAAFSLLVLGAFNSAGAAGGVPYDTAKFFCYSAATNDSGEIAVAFVAKSDTAGDSLWPVRYQKFRSGAVVADDTIMTKWCQVVNFGWARFALALDNDGWGHLAINADSNLNASRVDCLYLTNRNDGKWKKRYVINGVELSIWGSMEGRINCIAITNGRVDIITTDDYRVGGGYPFSTMTRIYGPIDGDSLNMEGVSSSSVGIYSEEIYGIAISNRCGRLVIYYGLRQSGGFAADRIIVSKSYPRITDYFFLELQCAWYLTVTPVRILSDEPTRIILGGAYQGTVYFSDSGLTGIKIPLRTWPQATVRNLLLKGQKVFDLSGRNVPSPLFHRPAGIYFSPATNDGLPTVKRVQISH